VCQKDGHCTLGQVRKDTQSVRLQYPRPRGGCKTCNVALCNRPSQCWEVYHTKFLGEMDKSVVDRWL
jgi:hypothetical protein